MIIECDDALRTHPQVVDIERTLQEQDPVQAADFFCYQPLFERILASNLPRAALAHALRRIAADASHQLPRFVMEQVLKGWTFLVTNRFAVSIGVRRVPRPTAALSVAAPEAHSPRIQPYPFDLFFGSLGGDDYEFERLCVEPSADAPAKQGERGRRTRSEPRLQWQSSGRMSVGKSLALRAGTDMITSKMPGSLVYLEISGPARCPILPQFDQLTREFSGWVSGDMTASRFELLTRTLAEFEFHAAAPRLAELARHRDHYVRWNSLRHLLRLDAALGVEQLRRAQSDEHPELRELAAATLSQLPAELTSAQTGVYRTLPQELV